MSSLSLENARISSLGVKTTEDEARQERPVDVYGGITTAIKLAIKLTIKFKT